MGRPKKADEVEECFHPETEETPVIKVPSGIDIQALVDSVRGRYTRTKKSALANDLTTGDNILLSNDADDYISVYGDKFWKPLTGILGLPYGRILQIAGRPDSGKSTAAMSFMKAAQESGALVVLWDAEKKFSARRYQQNIGGLPSSVMVVRNKQIVEGAKQTVSYVKDAKEQNPDIKILVVWDSVGATLNSAEDEENDDYSRQPGVTAKEVSWAIRRFNQLIERYRSHETGKETIAVLCINQVYANIGSVGFKQKGGAELEYLSSLILELTRKKTLKRVRQGQKKKFGIVSRANVIKNHLFDGEECVAELDLVVSADGIALAEEIKTKAADIVGWDGDEDDD